MKRLNQVLGFFIAVMLGSFLGTVSMNTLHAQSIQTAVVGWGGGTAPAYATILSQCPSSTVAGTYFNCIVLPATGTPFLAMSIAGYNGGAPFQLTFGPLPPSGGVTSVNGRSGAVVLGQGDLSYSQLSNLPVSVTCSTATIGPAGFNCASGAVIK